MRQKSDPLTKALSERWAASVFLIALLALPACQQPVSPDSNGSISAEMDRQVAEGRIGGVVTMVSLGGEIVHQHVAGFRDIESGDVLEVSDVFRIASQTKAVTTVAAMILVEEGELSLEDPLSKFIPEFADTPVAEAAAVGYRIVPLEREITIRHLMTHTSGISYGWGPAKAAFDSVGVLGWYLADRNETIQDMARLFARLPLTAQPGEQFVYGWSTDVLGAVVEIASGQPLDVFFQDRILGPLRMNDTHFFLPESKVGRLVSVYGLIEGELQRMPDGTAMETQGEYVFGPRKCFSGGAGLVSTASDYTRFMQMLIRGGELDGVRILTSESISEMTRDQLGDRYRGDRAGMGLGFHLQNENSNGPWSPGTFSWSGAYHSDYWVDPQNELTALILTQLIPPGDSDILERFRELVYE